MKQTATVASSYQSFLSVLATSVLFLVLALGALPSKASADVISVQTQQLLPPGQNTCRQISASQFTPYVYDNTLQSFEFTVSDPSYVALIASAGNTSIPFQFMTRKVSASGNLRIHVDMNSMPVEGTIPLSVTMISAAAGEPVCISVVSMSVGSGAVISSAPAVQPVSTPAPYAPQSSAKKAVSQGNTGMPASNTPGSLPSSATQTSAATPAGPVVSTMQNSIPGLCASQASAYRLWLILLVVFALLVGALLWAEFPMSLSWARTPERIATAILVLLLLLLGFWYFSQSCRAAIWMPLLAFLIAVLGLLAAFWNHPKVTRFLLIQDTKA